ncbi:MAG: very short patch repair endonuclease [Bacteroidetes bacterium]|nr:very short patch repair endonuclease [Bacteroidota bacterium]
MARVQAKSSIIEKKFASGLRLRKIQYRRHVRNVMGCPDFILPEIKVAIFCDSHFWHGYRWKQHKKDHKSNIAFWLNKIENNMARDKKVNRALRESGWKVLRFWEHQISSRLDGCLNKVEEFTKNRNVAL